jgi:integrase/recombinase XerD
VTPLRQRMLEDLQIRHYSPTTIRLYLYAVREFAKHFGKPPDQLGAEHIRRFQLFLTKEKKVSTSTYVLMVCALRFFYTHTLHRKVAIERIPFPRRERKLPLILSRDEVKALLEAPQDLRHRAMLAILYGSGLRVSEVARLKVADIDSARNVLWVRSGKGRRDRQALLPPKLRQLLRCYWRTRRPTDWFISRRRPNPSDLGESDLYGLPESCARGRHRQVGSSALAQARLRHPLARSRR